MLHWICTLPVPACTGSSSQTTAGPAAAASTGGAGNRNTGCANTLPAGHSMAARIKWVSNRILVWVRKSVEKM